MSIGTSFRVLRQRITTLRYEWIIFGFVVHVLFMKFIFLDIFINGHKDKETGLGVSQMFNYRVTLEEEMTAVQGERRGLLQQVCGETNNTHLINNKTTEHLLVDDRHKLIYCYVPKVACTHWKQVLVQASDRPRSVEHIHDTHALEQAGIRMLKELPEEERKIKLETYFKFIFVRNPVERILSAYRDKFVNCTSHWCVYFQHKFGTDMIGMFRTAASQRSLETGSDVAFAEFVKYIIRSSERGWPMNEHWDTYQSLCSPCSIKYDFIGKMDTMQRDAEYIMQTHFSNETTLTDSTATQFNGAYKDHTHSDGIVHDFYKDILQEDLQDLRKIYEKDLQMFGYKDL